MLPGVLNNVRRVNLMEAKNAPNSPVFINKVVIDEEERNPHAADQAARLLQKVYEVSFFLSFVPFISWYRWNFMLQIYEFQALGVIIEWVITIVAPIQYTQNSLEEIPVNSCH